LLFFGSTVNANFIYENSTFNYKTAAFGFKNDQSLLQYINIHRCKVTQTSAFSNCWRQVIDTIDFADWKKYI